MGACALKIVKYGLKQMGYSKNLTRVLTKITDQEFLDLMKDMEFRKKQINKGISLRDVRLDFIHQIYIQSMGEFQFTGGTPITPSYAVNDADMQKMVEHTNNRVCSMLFGKKWRKDKQQRPLTFVFFEHGSKTASRHIHTITSFPKPIIEHATRYMKLFREFWWMWEQNQIADRDFWFEEVRSNDVITRYAKKKLIAEQDAWFVLN